MMTYRTFGNTDLSVSAIGLGCYGMSGVYGAADDAENRRIKRPRISLRSSGLQTCIASLSCM